MSRTDGWVLVETILPRNQTSSHSTRNLSGDLDHFPLRKLRPTAPRIETLLWPTGNLSAISSLTFLLPKTGTRLLKARFLGSIFRVRAAIVAGAGSSSAVTEVVPMNPFHFLTK